VDAAVELQPRVPPVPVEGEFVPLVEQNGLGRADAALARAAVELELEIRVDQHQGEKVAGHVVPLGGQQQNAVRRLRLELQAHLHVLVGAAQRWERQEALARETCDSQRLGCI